MKKVDFVIFYEGFNREYQCICLLKKELEARGFSVRLSHFSLKDFYETATRFQPSVVLCPWLRYNENVFRFTIFKKPVKALVNLQWEQVYNNMSLREGLTSSSGESLKYVHLCWSEHSKRRMEADGVAPENLPIVGSVQLDFCRPEFLEDLFSRSDVCREFGLDPRKKLILFISSFAFASYTKDEEDRFLRDFGSVFEERFASERSNKQKTLEWLRAACAENPDKTFIYRPHPSERITEELLAAEKEIPNFRVISKYNIKQWIYVCDVINSWVSTSVAEIYFMGKKCNILRPERLSDDLEVEILNGADFVTTKEEFLRRTRDCESFPFPVSEERMNEFYSVEKEYAFRRAADVLEKLAKSDAVCPQPEFSAEEMKRFRKEKKAWLLGARYYRFCERTGRRLSRICPIKKRSLEYIEEKARVFSGFDYSGAEASVAAVFDRINGKSE